MTLIAGIKRSQQTCGFIAGEGDRYEEKKENTGSAAEHRHGIDHGNGGICGGKR